MRSSTSHFAHNQIAFRDHQIHHEAQVRERRAPHADDVLDQRMPILMLLTEIHEVLIEERADQFNPTVVPQLFELTMDARPICSMPIIKRILLLLHRSILLRT
jgi:hypothetical protein